MKSIVRIMFAVAAVALFSMSTPTEVNAQDYNAGYNYGLGFSIGNRGNNSGFHSFRGARRGFSARRGIGFPLGLGIGGGLLERSEDLPYFAKFPPVYYSGKVKRPYGISPYAVPPGIAPVEMQVAPVAQKVINPYFDQEVEPEAEVESTPVGTELEDQSTRWIANPYLLMQAAK